MAKSIVFKHEDKQMLHQLFQNQQYYNTHYSDDEDEDYHPKLTAAGFYKTSWFSNTDVPAMQMRMIINPFNLSVQICSNSHVQKLNAVTNARLTFDNNESNWGSTCYALAEIRILCAKCKVPLYQSNIRPQHIVMPFYHVTEHSVSAANHSSCRNPTTGVHHADIEVKLVRCGDMARTTASDILLKLMDEQLCTDVTLRVDKHKDLRAHRAILAAYSPVFKRMFENTSFSESQEGLVNFQDIKPEVLEAALECLYGKKVVVDFEGEVQMDLLVFAERYQLADLKAQCEEALSVNCIVHLLELLALAVNHNAGVLKEALMRRIVSCGNRKELFSGPVAKRFVEEHPQVAVALLSRI